MNERILIVEDEEKLARFIELELNYEGYQTSKAPDGRTGLAFALSGEFDLVALDIMLPDLNGFEVLRRIRQNSKVPVIMLTARDDVTDKVAGLDGGANDYITKPFAIEELLARIRVVLRSSGARDASASPLLVSGGLSLNPESREAQVGGRPVDLTKREFDLLAVLAEHKTAVLSRAQLLELVWGYDFAADTNVVDVFIGYLRRKLEANGGPRLLHTVRGVGFVLRMQ